jgi:hypothetical protein
MIRGGGASRKGEFRQRGLSRNENIVGLNPRPDGIERFEPVEEVGILRGRDGAREGLVKVMMRVDQPRQDDMTFEIKHFIGSLRKSARWPTCSMKPSRTKRPPSGISR